jgi:hypothetical protein
MFGEWTGQTYCHTSLRNISRMVNEAKTPQRSSRPEQVTRPEHCKLYDYNTVWV